MDARLQELERLVKIVDRLRAEDGCPWDREQTVETMVPCLQEETAEVADAVAGGQPDLIAEELGDVLMNVLLMSRISEQDGHSSLAEVAQGISDKLIRRHPHVFGEEDAQTTGQVLANWERIKKEEKSERGSSTESSLLQGVPAQMSSLATARKFANRVAKVGFDWPSAAEALEKVQEEVEEVRAAQQESQQRQEEEIGDLLFAVACFARKQDVDADLALRRACDRFRRRFQAVERALGDRLESATLEEMEKHWQEAKSREA